MESLFLRQVNTCIQKLDQASGILSVKDPENWRAGRRKETKGVKSETVETHLVDCKDDSVAQAVVKMLTAKGVKKMREQSGSVVVISCKK